MSLKQPRFVCTTPIRNEAKILDRFLECTSLWANNIIISDQCSEDNSKEIAGRYPKVTLVENFEQEYNEKQVRQILIDEARKINGPKIIFAVDADEVLSPEILSKDGINIFLSEKPGTVFMANFVNICPDMNHYWNGPLRLPVAFYDDGISQFKADKIHTFRNICPENAHKVDIDNIRIMHFQFTDWERMESKHRWYQCWERINNPKKRAIEIYRGYHHMYPISQDEMHDIPDFWFKEYKKMGINIDVINKDSEYYCDKTVLDYFNTYGTEFFKKEAIWDINWVEKANYYKYKNSEKFRDPRGKFQKHIHEWLKKTQADYNKLSVRIVSKLLKILFKQ
jgi:hypothetical protein